MTRFRSQLVHAALVLLPLALAGSGLLTLAFLMHARVRLGPGGDLRYLFPFGASVGPPPVRLLFGFTLVLSGVHLWARKKRALHMAVCLTFASSLLLWHSGHTLRSVEGLSITLLLLRLRRYFPLGSARPDFSLALRRAGFAIGLTVLYGTAGFWLVEPRHFGQNFHWWQAVGHTLRAMLLLGNAGIDALTPHGQRLLDSIFWLTTAALTYSTVILFRPVTYRFFQDYADRETVREIVAQYGRSAQDFFKQWPDKSFFLSATGRSFLAYRVSNNFALTLGDPVGPEEEFAQIIQQFVAHCHRQGWRAGFHQVRGDRIELYRRLGFRGMKIGDEAVVDLSRFALEGSAMKEFRNTVHRLKRSGYVVKAFDAPFDEPLFEQLRRVSEEWLARPGHRERKFTLGAFHRDYLASTRVYAAIDPEGNVAAFLNLTPSYDPELATVDLMRRGRDNVNGLMDFLFAMTFLDLKEKGFRKFSLGLAPFAEFHEDERPSPEERLVRWGLQHTPQLFRADTLRRFKAKYADEWEPCYEVYASRWDLPRFALALRSLTEGKTA